MGRIFDTIIDVSLMLIIDIMHSHVLHTNNRMLPNLLVLVLYVMWMINKVDCINSQMS